MEIAPKVIASALIVLAFCALGLFAYIALTAPQCTIYSISGNGHVSVSYCPGLIGR